MKFISKVTARYRMKYQITGTAQSFLNMLETSFYGESESELGNDFEDWLDSNESFNYWLGNSPYKLWNLKDMNPKSLKTHHDTQDIKNLDTIRKANPEDIPPIIVDHEMETVDGAHRLRVAQEEGWEHIRAWVPVLSSRMTEKEIEYLSDSPSAEETIKRMKQLESRI